MVPAGFKISDSALLSKGLVPLHRVCGVAASSPAPSKWGGSTEATQPRCLPAVAAPGTQLNSGGGGHAKATYQLNSPLGKSLHKDLFQSPYYSIACYYYEC